MRTRRDRDWFGLPVVVEIENYAHGFETELERILDFFFFGRVRFGDVFVEVFLRVEEGFAVALFDSAFHLWRRWGALHDWRF